MTDVPAHVADIVIALCLARVGVERQQRAIAAALDAGREPDVTVLLTRMHAELLDPPAPGEVARTRAALQARGVDILVPGSPAYPARLADAWPDLGAPLWLFQTGAASDVEAEPPPAVAVVGTRRPTADGLRVAEALASSMAAAGALVVSGMARGIDQAAHRAALAAGGRTAAVLGAGHGVDYPRGSEELRNAVSGSGGLFSEVLPGTPPRPQHFLARNRIISGLADVTVVVEGRQRSGALQTARMAAAQGRDVWAVPGSLNAPASQAPLALIRDGANVLTRVEDLHAALRLTVPRMTVPATSGGGRAAGGASPASTDPQLSTDDAAVLDLLGSVAVSIDELIDRTGRPAARILATVGRLRRRGLADADPAGILARGRG